MRPTRDATHTLPRLETRAGKLKGTNLKDSLIVIQCNSHTYRYTKIGMTIGTAHKETPKGAAFVFAAESNSEYKKQTLKLLETNIQFFLC